MLPHIRAHWLRRRILVDSHDLRVGVFWVEGHSAWLHLPGLVIRVRGDG
jgi:hypothetical protein